MNMDPTAGMVNEEVAHAAALWTQMGIPVMIMENRVLIDDPRSKSQRSDPVATFLTLRTHPKKLSLSLKTGPETGIVALSAYTYEPGVGMEALEAREYFCRSCDAGALIRHENFVRDVSDSRFHTVLYYSGADQFLETTLDEIPGITVHKSGEIITLPPSELRMLINEDIVQRSRWELEGSIAPSGIAYLPDELRKIIRKAERQTMSQKNPITAKGKVKANLFAQIFEGARDDTLTQRAGYLIGYKKLSKDDAFMVLRDINKRCCVPPLSDQDVLKIVNSIYKKHHSHG